MDEYVVVPYKWLGTPGQNLEHKFKEVAVGLLDFLSEVPPELRMDYVRIKPASSFFFRQDPARSHPGSQATLVPGASI